MLHITRPWDRVSFSLSTPKKVCYRWSPTLLFNLNRVPLISRNSDSVECGVFYAAPSFLF